MYQAGPAILGVEAGFNWMGLKGSTSNSALYPVTAPTGFTWNLQGKSDFLMTFLGRVGYNMGAWYPYVTGGLAVAHLKYTANFVDTFYPTNNTFSFNEYKPGWALGGGAEWRFAQHWLVRGEYLYMSFEFRRRHRNHCLHPRRGKLLADRQYRELQLPCEVQGKSWSCRRQLSVLTRRTHTRISEAPGIISRGFC